MELAEYVEGTAAVYTLQGKFTFSDYPMFRKVVQAFSEEGITHMTIDLSELEFIDSAALGMLLLVKEQAERRQGALVLRRPQGQIKRVFEVARFTEIFRIV